MAAAWNDLPATGGLHECAALVSSAEALRVSAPELSVQLARRALLVGATDASAGTTNAGEARNLSMRAQALLASGLVRISQHAKAVEPGFAALALAESGGAPDVAAMARIDLAACAQQVGEPLLGGALLRPVLEAAQTPPSVRATALGRLVGCVGHVARRDDIEDALAEADRLLAADNGLSPEVRRLERARLAVRSAGYHRWYGDTEDAVTAAREGLNLLTRVRSDLRSEGDRLRARLSLELVCGLLDEGEPREAEAAAHPVVDEPVRATSAASVGRLMLALATRVYLPGGQTERGRHLLDQTAWTAERHALDGLRADALSELSRLDEQAGRAGDALEALRAARAAEHRRMRAVSRAARIVLVEVGASHPVRDTSQQSVAALVRRLAHPAGLPVAVAPPPQVGPAPVKPSPEPQVVVPAAAELAGTVDMDDEGTRLLDREALFRRLHSVRTGERPVALTLVRFEQNQDDDRGPDTGIMAGLADKVRDMAPDNAEVARSDGGELAVILPSTTRDQAEEFAANIRETAIESGWAGAAGKDMSISTGVVQTDQTNTDAADMLTAARDALTPAQTPPSETSSLADTSAALQSAMQSALSEDTPTRPLTAGRSILSSLSIPSGSGGRRRAGEEQPPGGKSRWPAEPAEAPRWTRAERRAQQESNWPTDPTPTPPGGWPTPAEEPSQGKRAATPEKPSFGETVALNRPALPTRHGKPPEQHGAGTGETTRRDLPPPAEAPHPTAEAGTQPPAGATPPGAPAPEPATTPHGSTSHAAAPAHTPEPPASPAPAAGNTPVLGAAASTGTTAAGRTTGNETSEEAGLSGHRATPTSGAELGAASTPESAVGAEGTGEVEYSGRRRAESASGAGLGAASTPESARGVEGAGKAQVSGRRTAPISGAELGAGPAVGSAGGVEGAGEVEYSGRRRAQSASGAQFGAASAAGSTGDVEGAGEVGYSGRRRAVPASGVEFGAAGSGEKAAASGEAGLSGGPAASAAETGFGTTTSGESARATGVEGGGEAEVSGRRAASASRGEPGAAASAAGSDGEAERSGRRAAPAPDAETGTAARAEGAAASGEPSPGNAGAPARRAEPVSESGHGTAANVESGDSPGDASNATATWSTEDSGFASGLAGLSSGGTLRGAEHTFQRSSYEETKAELARMMSALNAKSLAAREGRTNGTRQPVPAPSAAADAPEPPARPDLPEPAEPGPTPPKPSALNPTAPEPTPPGPTTPTPDQTQAPTRTPSSDLTPMPTPTPDLTPMPNQPSAPTRMSSSDLTPMPGQTPLPDQMPTRTPSSDLTPMPDQAPLPDQEPAPRPTPEPGQRSGLMAAFDALTGPLPGLRAEFDDAPELPARKPAESWAELQSSAVVESPADELFGTAAGERPKFRSSLGAAFAEFGATEKKVTEPVKEPVQETAYDEPIGPQRRPDDLPRRGEKSSATIASLLTEALAAYQSTAEDAEEHRAPERFDSYVADESGRSQSGATGRHRSPE